jgi:hypothetical protein
MTSWNLKVQQRTSEFATVVVIVHRRKSLDLERPIRYWHPIRLMRSVSHRLQNGAVGVTLYPVGFFPSEPLVKLSNF